MYNCEFRATGQLQLAAGTQCRRLYPQPTSCPHRLASVALRRSRQAIGGKAPHFQLLHNLDHPAAVVAVTVAHDQSIESPDATLCEVGEDNLACNRPIRGWTGNAVAGVEHDVMPRRIADKSAIPLSHRQHRDPQILRGCQYQSGH